MILIIMEAEETNRYFHVYIKNILLPFPLYQRNLGNVTQSIIQSDNDDTFNNIYISAALYQFVSIVYK